jgi:hypothetical protein
MVDSKEGGMRLGTKIPALTAAAALAGGLAIANGGSAGGQTTESHTFTFTGADQTFQVPDGVSAITVDASGAQGGTAADPPSGGSGSGGPGGNGTQSVATIAVTPGEELMVIVGGQGDTSTSTGGGAGGFGGRPSASRVAPAAASRTRTTRRAGAGAAADRPCCEARPRS